MLPSDPQWSSYVEAPLCVANERDVDWSDAADVVIVGFGGAGVCAALEARELGAEVVVIDRFEGGGATALSGGVYYGGGTRIQQEAGLDDTADEMFKYLSLDTLGVVSDTTLRRFCDESASNLDWLTHHGVRFNATVSEAKTTYPPAEAYLYYSGNERLVGYRDKARPAPRGHRTYGTGFTGNVFFASLRKAALDRGVRALTHAPVTRLVVDGAGTVIGVEVRRVPLDTKPGKLHRRLIRRVNAFLRFRPESMGKVSGQLVAIEQAHGVRQLIRARQGVVLATGSFAFNRDMMTQYAPKYVDNMPLGSAGCDGSGIRLGQSVGGDVGCMGNVSPWRSIAPPESFVGGVVVDAAGQRVCPEDAYCAKLGHLIAEDHNNRAWLIIDRDIYRKALKTTVPRFGSRFMLWATFGLPLFFTLTTQARKASSIGELAQCCGIDPDGLSRSIADYNEGVARGEDPMGKSQHYHHALVGGPYYAIDISGNNRKFPCPSIPMGGLRVDEETGLVRRVDGSTVPRLYAAGRTAVGIPSKFYVSGTAIADCVFSGRRAGRSAASNAEA